MKQRVTDFLQDVTSFGVVFGSEVSSFTSDWSGKRLKTPLKHLSFCILRGVTKVAPALNRNQDLTELLVFVSHCYLQDVNAIN